MMFNLLSLFREMMIKILIMFSLPSSRAVYHWFAQNLLIEHPAITPIPIGLETNGFTGTETLVILVDFVKD